MGVARRLLVHFFFFGSRGFLGDECVHAAHASCLWGIGGVYALFHFFFGPVLERLMRSLRKGE